jgi:hypothetical protein
MLAGNIASAKRLSTERSRRDLSTERKPDFSSGKKDY